MSFRPLALDALTAIAGISPAAQALSHPGMTPLDLAQGLAARGLYRDATALLAHGLTDEAGVKWAAESARRARRPLDPSEQSTLDAAEAWRRGDSGAEGDQLHEVIKGARFQGPGDWAAQAAAWAAEDAIFGEERLTPKAVEGAVMLSATLVADSPPGAGEVPIQPPSAIPAEASDIGSPPLNEHGIAPPASPLAPKEAAALDQALRPFVELGLRIAQEAALQGLGSRS